MPETAKRPKHDLPFANDAEIAVLVGQFENCTWPYERWTHRAHLAVAVTYLRDNSFEAAVQRMRESICRYNRTCGDPTGYHETITLLFLRRIARRLRDIGSGASSAAIVDELVRDCDMHWPLAYYSKERLWSPEARATWVEPDLRPLDF